MNFLKSLFLILFISNFVGIPSFSQNLQFKHYGLPEGLPQETIRCITKDKMGFYWIGTADGLVRFDGHDFLTIEAEFEKGETLTGIAINDLVEDSHQNIWIATSQNGVFKYNYISEKLEQIGLKNTNATKLIVLKKETVFVSYLKKGIYKIYQEKGSYKNTKISFNQNNINITALAAKDNLMFVGTNSNGLFYFNLNNTPKVLLKKVPSNIALGKINKLVLFENEFWICAAKGLFSISEKHIITKIPLEKNLSNTTTLSIYDIQKKGTVYYVASNNGFIELVKNPNFKLVKHYISTVKYSPNTPNDNVIKDLYLDKNLLFLGGNNLDITNVSKHEIIKLVSTELNVGDPSVFSFLKHKNNFFVATTSGLLVINDKHRIDKIHLPISRIRTMTKDPSNNLWIAALNKILVLPLDNLDVKNPVYTTINPFKNNDGNTLVRRLFTDNLGSIWIATNGDGLYRFTGNLSKNEHTFVTYRPNDTANSLASGFILWISQDAKNNFWLSTQTGLSKMSFANNLYKNPKFINYFKGENGLKTNGILSTFTDSDKELWVATRKGLHKFENEKFTFFGKKEGLSNTFVYNVLEDNLDNLWLSTNGGIFRFNKQTKTFSNYTVKDGLQSSEFNLGAAFKDTETGNLYFGGINGFNYFNPNEIDKLDKEGNLILTNFSIKEKKVSPINSSILDKSISQTKEITINYKDFPFNLSFSALDFRPNSNIEYVYKLLPQDQQWNRLKDKNYLQLLNLSPKSYTLQIQGMSRGKLWKKLPLEIIINVTPPWYRSTFAYFLYLLLFLGTVYFLYTNSLQKKLAGQETKRLQELDALKSRFITNITHEFRTPLTIILGFLDTLKDTFKDKKDTLTTLNTIEQNSNNLLSLVNQMLDLSKLEKGSLSLNLVQNDIVLYIKHLVNSFNNIVKDKNIELQFKSNCTELIMDFDAEKIRQIFTNLLSNAIKFSKENTSITVKLSKKNGFLKVKVKDQGFGIPEKEISQIFDRFYQVDNSNFKIAQGTGIGLALTKELITLMQGEIEVRSKINKGTTFTVMLPIQNTAKIEDKSNLEQTIKIKHSIVPKNKDIINVEDTNTILIVEDNPDMARYIQSCLISDFKTILAPNGKEGLDIAINQIPDLILTDVMMPIMDGYELTKELQTNEITNHIPIIILTSKAMQSEKMEGLTSGAEAYLTKPFSKKELILRIKKIIEKRTVLQQKYQVSFLPSSIQKTNKQDKKLDFLLKVTKCIYTNLDNSKYNAIELAKDLKISESQLYRKLKAITNFSTAIFIRKIRLKKAKEMLKNTDLTVSEIAYACGFNDPSWFSRAFKKEFEITPNQARN